MKAAGIAILLCMALALVAGCGSEDGDSASSSPGADTAREASAEEPKGTKPKVEVPEGPPPKELVKNDLVEGSGPAVKTGDEVSVHYVLVEYKNGKEVEASWDRDEPFEFQVGSGSVIPGWEQGVVGMKAGGRRELVVPSQLAYGSGALVFVIDLLEIGGGNDESDPGSDADSDSEPEYEERPKPKVRVPAGPAPKEVVVNDLEEGTGAAVKEGDEIVVNYVGVSYKTGKEFESTWDQGQPNTFPVGGEVLIDGWEQGIKGMKVGGRRELQIPSELAFKKGPVVYVIDLLEIK